MSLSPKLKLDWASAKAARFACEHWHYSGSMPCSKAVKVGVWEDEKYIGCLIFSPGATPLIGSPYGLAQTEICELTRIALTKHANPVSKIMAIAIRMLKRFCPGLQLLVSYADPDQLHHGGIYQATNWIYAGKTTPACFLKVNGVVEHRKTIYERYGNNSLQWILNNVDPKAERIRDQGKHKYLMPMCAKMKAKCMSLAKPYPKRVGSKDNVATGDQPVEGGVNPTPTLHSNVAEV